LLINSLLSLLLLLTFSWGGCVSCEQFFMFAGSQSCCAGDGHCKKTTPAKRTSSQDCKQLAFEHHNGIDHQIHSPAMISTWRAVTTISTAEILRYTAELNAIDTSPPDRQALNSTFLI
jgi:hypothetical protein